MIYKLRLSTKETISIDDSDYEKFKKNVGSNFIEFRSGIINPSFVVSITPDIEASREEAQQLKNKETLAIANAPMDFTKEDTQGLRKALEVDNQ